MTHSEWLRICQRMTMLWPHRPMPPEAAEAWYPLLADLPGAAIMAAVNTYALGPDATWPPSLGQLRAAAEPPDRPWEDALADLRPLMARRGSHSPRPPSSEVEDPALDAVIDVYGWAGICAMEHGNPTARAQFRDAYRAQQKAQREAGRRVHAAEITSGQRREIGA